jgi:hypothetical protein
MGAGVRLIAEARNCDQKQLVDSSTIMVIGTKLNPTRNYAVVEIASQTNLSFVNGGTSSDNHVWDMEHPYSSCVSPNRRSR